MHDFMFSHYVGGNFLWNGAFVPFFALIAIWTIVWKGLALWRAARQDSRGWFVALLIINTAGILEILYLYVFSKKNSHNHHHSSEPHGPHAEHSSHAGHTGH